MDRETMIEQILDFVGQNRESHASRNVYRRILGTYPEQIDRRLLSELRKGLQEAGPETVEACYYLVK